MNIKKYVIGFGDSLTWGYCCEQKDQNPYPYSIKLNNLFQANNLNYESINYGVNGELTEDMKKRFLEQYKPIFAEEKFNFIIKYQNIIFKVLK
jgi:hypothetical protein